MVSITGLFEPVEIDGTAVSRAYLHNLDIFDEFQFGVGDTIQVYKANMIIPQIARNDTQSNTFTLPMTCPCCGEPLTVKTTSGGTRQLFCENPHCTARLVQKFDHFYEKTRMDIEGLSATTLARFIGHGWIRNFGDLYNLEQHREEIVNTEGFGEKSFERLQSSVEKSRSCTLAKFIAGYDCNGSFIESLNECVEVTHYPDETDIWNCANCQFSAAGSKFQVSPDGQKGDNYET